MSMKGEIIVLHANRWDYEKKGADGKLTGKRSQGCQVTYIDGSSASGSDERGVVVNSVGADFGAFSDLKDTPGVYEASFVSRPAQNKFGQDIVQLQILGLHYLRPFPITSAGAGGAVNGAAAPVLITKNS